MAPMPDFKSLIERELVFFSSEAMKEAFLEAAVPPYEVSQQWQYGDQLHSCWVVAQDSTDQIVYCQTGFGPDFPWSDQFRESNDLGMDGQWCAYLVEAFVGSSLWRGEVPSGFMLMGPGERETDPDDPAPPVSVTAL